MEDQILSWSEVAAKTSLSRDSVRRQIERGSFPAPIKLGPRRVGWKQSDIRQWLDQVAA